MGSLNLDSFIIIAIVPALPLPQTSATTDEEGQSSPDFLCLMVDFQVRRADPIVIWCATDDRLVRIAIQRWFARICDDPIIQRDEELRSFVESDFGVSKPKSGCYRFAISEV